MDLEFWALFFLIVAVMPIIIKFIHDSSSSNIFFQKIEYLNQELRYVKKEDFKGFKISAFKEFTHDSSISIGSEPEVWKSNMENDQYRLLIEEQINRPKKLKVFAVKTVFVLLVVESILGASYLMF